MICTAAKQSRKTKRSIESYAHADKERMKNPPEKTDSMIGPWIEVKPHNSAKED